MAAAIRFLILSETGTPVPTGAVQNRKALLEESCHGASRD